METNYNDNTITSDLLSTDTQPLKLPEETFDTTASQFIESTATEAQTALDKKALENKQKFEASQGDVTGLMQQVGLIEGKLPQYEQELGVNELDQQISDIQGAIDVESRVLKNTLNRINTNKNLTRTVANRQISDAERKSASFVADLAVTQSILGRNYDRAVEKAKQKVAVQVAPLKADLELKKFIYEQNKEAFNDTEKAQLNKIIADEEREYESQKKDKETVAELGISVAKNGAPASIYQQAIKAGNMEELLKIPNIDNYLTSPKEKLELTKLGIDIQKSSAEYAKTIMELNQAKNVIGGTTGDTVSDLILGSSQYSGKQPSAGWIDDFTQAGVALGNVKELQSLIEKEGGTGIIKGNISNLLSKFSGGFANSAAINAQIQRTVPGLARGIFKEVGVLTDQDIQNYKRTLPNLTSPEQQNKLALLATYDVIERSMAISLANQAKAKNDVSGYQQDYIDVKNQVNALKAELGFVDAVEESPIAKSYLDTILGGTVQTINNTVSGYASQFSKTTQ
jgi:hypothetical protein